MEWNSPIMLDWKEFLSKIHLLCWLLHEELLEEGCDDVMTDGPLIDETKSFVWHNNMRVGGVEGRSWSKHWSRTSTHHVCSVRYHIIYSRFSLLCTSSRYIHHHLLACVGMPPGAAATTCRHRHHVAMKLFDSANCHEHRWRLKLY